MDIKHLRYFIAIVENDFNLSRTAELLYISQPTLSIMINDFENREGRQLFKRDQGKILGLSQIGEQYYQDALDVIKKYNEMQENLHRPNEKITGNIQIGIPPLVLSVVFSTIMPKLILDNPSINFVIREHGAHRLKSELMMENVDLAVLLYPEGISKNIVESVEIQRSELAVFMSPNHRLANKDLIQWQDLQNEKLAIFDETFMIHHLLNDSFTRHNVHPKIILKSSSWDFMLNSTKINEELLTILPLPISQQYASSEFICRQMAEPIPWRVMLSRLKKNNYTNIEKYIFDTMLNLVTAYS
ncbi:HTH-type transcriptional regulator [Enterococcus canis]|uniref:HTH-type transcriptional regulator n=1 Tax=Enterococcus canis TaxID=214095 RepID=A0A1L8RID5_9ENTE|nr:LysR family transcriptional regulator [Enterococcus canis]OJG19493.1 HTH-type transcriptional regulator [Enterococcus canis]